MAKKENTDEGEKTGGSAQKKAKSVTFKTRLWLAFTILVGVVFLPTSMLLFIGMLPSIVAFVVLNRISGAKISTVTAMNLAGCIPFIFKLWSSGNDFEASMGIITNTRYVTIMYTAAAFGYMIDWVVTGIVSSFLYQRGVKRMDAIKIRQKELKEQWGDAVDGSSPQNANYSVADGGDR